MEKSTLKMFWVFFKAFKRLLISQQVTIFCNEIREAKQKLSLDDRVIRKDWEVSETLQLSNQQNNGKLNSNG